MLAAHGVTDTGRVRKINEDALFWNIELGIFLVADGMGGHNAGEVASQLAVDTIRDFISKSHADTEATMPFGIDPRLSHDGNRVATAIRLANSNVYNTAEANPAYAGMGTTATLALVRGNLATYAGVGDSRIYSLLGGELTQLTQDDSWVERIRTENPEISEEVLQANPLRHVLTNVVGARAETEVRVHERRLTDGELLLLCSDGLYGPLVPGVLQRLMAEPVDVETKAQKLLTAALDAGSRDNVTALVVEYRA